mmetsp:Transcript_29615/g.46508  ORF Transcript_29615/g.46508 Transcript_29615/m.46508 type:complete len:358 (-) Transcript_29615:1250-2323(-)
MIKFSHAIGCFIIFSSACIFSVCHGAKADDAAQMRSPRNKYWDHILKEQSGLKDGHEEHFDDIQSCIMAASPEINDLVVPTIVDTLRDSQNRTILVEIQNAITSSQVESVKELAACTRFFFPESRFEHRGFEGSGGGNDCTYLNILLQIFLPEVFENVVNIAELAYKEAGWGEKLQLPPPNKCGLRTSEYLNYNEFKRLGVHTDTGSLFTALFALSDPKLYQGGEFYILPWDEPDDRLYYFKPRQYSAVVFLSETNHGVTDLEGPREMFTNEFWVYDDAPWDASTRAENAHMDVFVQRAVETLDHTVDYYKWEDLSDLWPHGEEIEEFDDYASGHGFYEDEGDELNAKEGELYQQEL